SLPREAQQRRHGHGRRPRDPPPLGRQRDSRGVSGHAASRESGIGLHLRRHARRAHAGVGPGNHGNIGVRVVLTLSRQDAKSLRGQVMKIAVCIKRVADSETRVKTAADGKSLDDAGVKFILNPYDEFAVEEALQRKEKAGAGEVVVVALGPAAAQETIRTALAMGADRGILLQSDRIPPDGLEVAKALAAELKGAGFDLILFGKMAIDDYNHQVGPMVAELLDVPCVTAVAHLDLESGKGVAEREIE